MQRSGPVPPRCLFATRGLASRPKLSNARYKVLNERRGLRDISVRRHSAVQAILPTENLRMRFTKAFGLRTHIYSGEVFEDARELCYASCALSLAG